MEASLVAAELRKIEDRNGRLTPNAVVAAAKSPKHPLHDHFEWDDLAAGHQWRLKQARQLISGVRIEIETEERTISAIAYIRDPAAAAENEQGYRAVVRLSNDRDDARAAVAVEFSRAEAALRRARDVATALGYADKIDKLIGRIIRLSEKIESGRASGAAA